MHESAFSLDIGSPVLEYQEKITTDDDDDLYPIK